MNQLINEIRASFESALSDLTAHIEADVSKVEHSFIENFNTRIKIVVFDDLFRGQQEVLRTLQSRIADFSADFDSDAAFLVETEDVRGTISDATDSLDELESACENLDIGTYDLGAIRGNLEELDSMYRDVEEAQEALSNILSQLDSFSLPNVDPALIYVRDVVGLLSILDNNKQDSNEQTSPATVEASAAIVATDEIAAQSS